MGSTSNLAWQGELTEKPGHHPGASQPPISGTTESTATNDWKTEGNCPDKRLERRGIPPAELSVISAVWGNPAIVAEGAQKSQIPPTSHTVQRASDGGSSSTAGSTAAGERGSRAFEDARWRTILAQRHHRNFQGGVEQICELRLWRTAWTLRRQ